MTLAAERLTTRDMNTISHKGTGRHKMRTPEWVGVGQSARSAPPERRNHHPTSRRAKAPARCLPTGGSVAKVVADHRNLEGSATPNRIDERGRREGVTTARREGSAQSSSSHMRLAIWKNNQPPSAMPTGQ
jgi:hypothetical protein